MLAKEEAMPDIELAAGAEDAPLTGLLADLLTANLEDNPGCVTDFNRLRLNVGIDAVDAESQVTLEFREGKLTVHNGMLNPAMVIIADVETLLAITNINVRYGMPWYFDRTGFEVIVKLLKRELRIKGMLRHPLALTRLTKVMSVAQTKWKK
jgi:hypothetical protein